MKKLIISAALLYGGYKLFEKKQQIDELKGILKIRPKKMRNIKFIPGGINLDVDINMVNDSPLNFSLNSLGTIYLKKINLFTPEGVHFGTAFPNISKITIPPHTNILLPNVPATISTKNITGTIASVIQSPDDIFTTSEIEILGQKYII